MSEGRGGQHPGRRVGARERGPGPNSGASRVGSVTVGGRRAVLEAIRSGRAREVRVSRDARSTEGLREVIQAATEAEVPLERVERSDLDRLGVPDHQGVAALVRSPAERDEGDLMAMTFEPDALVVVLDGVTDPQNLGACARAAEAAGAAVLIARKRRAAPLTPAAVRSSAGALLHLPVARVTNIARTLEALRDRGFFVTGLDHRADMDIHRVPPPPRPVALVAGAEDAGLARLTREACDTLVSIPMRGRTASLNVASALAVGLFAYVLRDES